MKKIDKIGTHDGAFHADEAFAVAILKLINPKATVIRSRNPEVLATCDIVVDVGGGEYDHHTNDKQYRLNGIPYASAGLVWGVFGFEIVSEKLVGVLDEKLFQGIDALDNGHTLECDNSLVSVSSLISSFNPTWNGNEDENKAFDKAVSFASTIITNMIRTEESVLATTSIVKEALNHRVQKEILVLDTDCPWTESLLELDTNNEVLFVVFPDQSGEFRIQVVPKENGSFIARKSLPETWGGKRNGDLDEILDIDDAVFCHPARFIAGAKSKESILKMAQLALM